uniref:Uncharacterized protein n=1 Tax=Rhizophora mucronata TaxID=61149 RepID=A0A2P2QZK6_RHIMU
MIKKRQKKKHHKMETLICTSLNRLGGNGQFSCCHNVEELCMTRFTFEFNPQHENMRLYLAAKQH